MAQGSKSPAIERIAAQRRGDRITEWDGNHLPHKGQRRGPGFAAAKRTEKISK